MRCVSDVGAQMPLPEVAKTVPVECGSHGIWYIEGQREVCIHFARLPAQLHGDGTVRQPMASFLKTIFCNHVNREHYGFRV